MREPGPHQGIIPFPSIDCWLLRAPSQCPQSTGQVVRMVAHPKGHQNDRTDAQERPPVRLKASLESAFVEDRQHALPLLNAQAGGPAGNGMCAQTAYVAVVLPELSSPLAHSHPTDAESAGDLGVGQLTSVEQSSSFQAAFFTLCAGEVCWAPDHGRLL